MAYSMTRQERLIIASGDATSTSTAGRIPCLTRPFYVRRAAVQILVAGTVAAIVVTIKKRITYASDTGAVAIGTLTLPSATSAVGTVVYLDDLNTKIGYSEELYAVVSTAATSTGTIDVSVELEDAPDNLDAFNASDTTYTEVTA